MSCLMQYSQTVRNQGQVGIIIHKLGLSSRPLSHQEVGEIERRAFSKVKRLMQRDFKGAAIRSKKPELGGHDNKFSNPFKFKG